MMGSQSGFTLMEWTIAAVISLFLVIGPVWFLVHASVQLERHSQEGLLLETARYTIDRLVTDIRSSRFLGPYTAREALPIQRLPMKIENNCNPGDDDFGVKQPIAIYPIKDDGTTGLSCIQPFSEQSLVSGSYILELSSAQNLVSIEGLKSEQIYLGLATTGLFLGVGTDLSSRAVTWIYPYRRQFYYLQRKNNGISALYRVYLSRSKMVRETTELVRGVENLQIRFVVHSDTENRLRLQQVAPDLPDQIKGLELSILFRSEQPVYSSSTHQEFLYPSGIKQSFHDRYLRRLITRVISLNTSI